MQMYLSILIDSNLRHSGHLPWGRLLRAEPARVLATWFRFHHTNAGNKTRAEEKFFVFPVPNLSSDSQIPNKHNFPWTPDVTTNNKNTWMWASQSKDFNSLCTGAYRETQRGGERIMNKMNSFCKILYKMAQKRQKLIHMCIYFNHNLQSFPKGAPVSHNYIFYWSTQWW